MICPRRTRSRKSSRIIRRLPPTFFTTGSPDIRCDIAVADLATNWSDADGDTVSLAGIGVSTNGVTVTNNAGTLVYFDTNNVDDQFVCTISDGWGGTNFQTVYIDDRVDQRDSNHHRRGERFKWQRDVEPRRGAG